MDAMELKQGIENNIGAAVVISTSLEGMIETQLTKAIKLLDEADSLYEQCQREFGADTDLQAKLKNAKDTIYDPANRDMTKSLAFTAA